MGLPGFIGVGAAKSGTTLLFQLMQQHKDVYVPKQKECHFFNSDDQYAYGAHYYESRFFSGHTSEKIAGEITPLYMLYQDVPGRIRETLGSDIKLIFCFRNPAKRAFSNYLQNVRMLWECESFETAIAQEPERVAAGNRFGLMRAYLYGGYYAQQLEWFLNIFPRENMFISVFEEDWLVNREATFARLLSFLGVGQDNTINFNVSGNKSKPPKLQIIGDQPVFILRNNKKIRLPKGAVVFTTGFPGIDRIIARPSEHTTRFFTKLDSAMTVKMDEDFSNELLQRHFLQDIRKLEALIGRDLSVWYKDKTV